MRFQEIENSSSVISIPLEPLIKDYERKTNDSSYFECCFCFQCFFN
jgi:hypothetical protein